MYHQKIPSYDGAQPFIYAVYCKEDETLVFPVLARMYNEGFRVCCAPATGISSDFHTQQRLAAASNVILFVSQQMAERIRIGDPEVVAASRSPLVRTLILLDDADVKDSAFAMSVPDHVPYRAGNDSPFWLYVYSNDYFDPCRGPWPEKKLLLREPVYEDISEEVVDEEYRNLESIMFGVKKEEQEFDPFDPDQLYPNNPGYIQPQPDEYTYIPLETLAVAKSEHDNQLDEVIELINQAEDHVAASRRQAAEAAQPVKAEPVEEFKPVEITVREAEKPAEEPEPEEKKAWAEPKADRIVAFTEHAKPVPEPIELPEPEIPAAVISERENMTAAEMILASSAILSAGEPVEEPVEEPAVEKRSGQRRSSVPVMVKLHQPACHVQPVKCRTIRQIIEAPAVTEREAVHVSQAADVEKVLPPSVSDSSSFEQYIRNIARSVISAFPTEAKEKEEPAQPIRKFRQRVAAVEEPAVEDVQQPAEPVAAESAEEQKSARKNRYPHQNTGLLGELIEALRNRRSLEPEEKADETVSDDAAGQSGAGVLESIVADSADMLQNVVERFIEANAVPARMVVPQMVRRSKEQ